MNKDNSIGYNICPDSKKIAKMLENMQYDKKKREQILAKYEKLKELVNNDDENIS